MYYCLPEEEYVDHLISNPNIQDEEHWSVKYTQKMESRGRNAPDNTVKKILKIWMRRDLNSSEKLEVPNWKRFDVVLRNKYQQLIVT